MKVSVAVLAGLVFAAAPASRAQVPVPPDQTSPGNPVQSVPADVTGATRVEYDDKNQQVALEGAPVVVVHGTLRLAAPQIRYSVKEHQVSLPGGGTVSSPTIEVTADRIDAWLRTRHVTAEGHVHGRFLLEGSWAAFAAGRVEADDRPDARQIVATGDVVVKREDAELHGDRLAYDRLTQQGTLDGHAELIRGSDRLRADHLIAYVDRREVEAHDHVLLDREDMQGSADQATYTEPTQTAVLSGHVVLTRGKDTLTAERVTVHLDQHTAIAEGRPQMVAYPPEPSP